MAALHIEIESDAPGLTAKVREWLKRVSNEAGLDKGDDGQLYPLLIIATVDNDGVVEPVFGSAFDPDGLDLDSD
jgi:hypothetical protein